MMNGLAPSGEQRDWPSGHSFLRDFPKGFVRPALTILTSTDETSINETPNVDLSPENFTQAEFGFHEGHPAMELASILLPYLDKGHDRSLSLPNDDWKNTRP